jgi:hypothetical protein
MPEYASWEGALRSIQSGIAGWRTASGTFKEAKTEQSAQAFLDADSAGIPSLSLNLAFEDRIGLIDLRSNDVFKTVFSTVRDFFLLAVCPFSELQSLIFSMLIIAWLLFRADGFRSSSSSSDNTFVSVLDRTPRERQRFSLQAATELMCWVTPRLLLHCFEQYGQKITMLDNYVQEQNVTPKLRSFSWLKRSVTVTFVGVIAPKNSTFQVKSRKRNWRLNYDIAYACVGDIL